MKEAEWEYDDQLSLFEIGTTLLRNRWRILAGMIVGASIAVIPVLRRPPYFASSASFVLRGSDVNRAGLASLAAQFGAALPTANQSQTPEFYAQLLKSRQLLSTVGHDTLAVAELGGRRATLFDLFEIEAPPRAREERAVLRFAGLVTTGVTRTTGIVQLTVSTPWPTVSATITQKLLDGVNAFNRQTKQGEAATERKFVEQQLAVATGELRAAEDGLEGFLRANKEYRSSAALTFTHDRLEREVMLKQQLYTQLMQSYQDVRIREVRDVPVIQIVEPPAVPSTPLARGRGKRALAGLLLGGFLVGLWVVVARQLTRRRGVGDAVVDEFFGSLGEAKRNLLPGFGRKRAALVDGSTVSTMANGDE